MYSKTSPYYTTDMSNGYLDVMSYRDIPYLANDLLFEITATYENRPDLLAYDLYQDSTLWWVFAIRNRTTIKDPIYDFKAGVRIYIPQQSTINSMLGM